MKAASIMMMVAKDDWRGAIDEAARVSSMLEASVSLGYRGQKFWHITPDMTAEEIEQLKSEPFRIGV